MKKFMYCMATAMVIALSAVIFTSCSKDDDGEKIISYHYGWDSTHFSDLSVMTKIDNAYMAEFAKLPGVQISGGYIMGTSGADISGLENSVVSACKTAEANINASGVTTKSFGTGTYTVEKVGNKGTDTTIYTKTWSK